jgi:hypothetical protein
MATRRLLTSVTPSLARASPTHLVFTFSLSSRNISAHLVLGHQVQLPEPANSHQAQIQLVARPSIVDDGLGYQVVTVILHRIFCGPDFQLHAVLLAQPFAHQALSHERLQLQGPLRSCSCSLLGGLQRGWCHLLARSRCRKTGTLQKLCPSRGRRSSSQPLPLSWHSRRDLQRRPLPRMRCRSARAWPESERGTHYYACPTRSDAGRTWGLARTRPSRPS